MNIELLRSRLTQLEEGITNAANTYQMLVGHKAEAQHWLSEIMKAEPVPVDQSIANTDENVVV